MTDETVQKQEDGTKNTLEPAHNDAGRLSRVSRRTTTRAQISGSAIPPLVPETPPFEMSL